MLLLPDDLCRLVLSLAVARTDWPGGWIAVFRLVSWRARQLFTDVARSLPPELGWLTARSNCCNCCNSQLRFHEPPWAGPPLAPMVSNGPGDVLEVHLSHVGLADAGMVRLVRALRAQPCVKLLEVSYNPFGLLGFRALTEEMVSSVGYLLQLKVLLTREILEWSPEDELSYYLERPEEYPVGLWPLDEKNLAWGRAVMAFQHSERRQALEEWDSGLD